MGVKSNIYRTIVGIAPEIYSDNAQEICKYIEALLEDCAFLAEQQWGIRHSDSFVPPHELIRIEYELDGGK